MTRAVRGDSGEVCPSDQRCNVCHTLRRADVVQPEAEPAQTGFREMDVVTCTITAIHVNLPENQEVPALLTGSCGSLLSVSIPL